MVQQTETLDLTADRQLWFLTLAGDTVDEEAARQVRETIQPVCRAASVHGLTRADVLRGVLAPR